MERSREAIKAFRACIDISTEAQYKTGQGEGLLYIVCCKAPNPHVRKPATDG